MKSLKTNALAFLAVLLALAPAHAGRDKTFDYSGKGPELFDYAQVISSDGLTVTTRPTSRIPKLLGVSSTNVLGEWYAGYSSAGDLLDLSGNSRDLADTHAPPIVNSSLVGADGNQLQAFSYNGSSQYHSLAHAGWMNVFDGDFSLSVLVKSPSSAVGNKMFFCHGQASGDGFYFRVNGSFGYFEGIFNKAGSSVTVSGPAVSYLDNLYHLVCIVRSGLFATIYVDGVPGAPVDVGTASFGIDGSRTLYIGAYDGGGNSWNSHIAYTRLQNSALTYSQIQKEVGLFQGNLASRSGGQLLTPTFQRTTSGTTTGVSTVERRTGTYSLAQVPQNWPVKSSDGATLVEASFTQLLTYTENLSGVQWGMRDTDILSLDGATDPRGTATLDGIIASANNVAHGVQQSVAGLSAVPYVLSTYVKKGNQNYFAIQNTTIANCHVIFNLNTGTVGTAIGVNATTYGIRPTSISGVYRVWLGFTAAAGSNTFLFRPQSTDAVNTWAGDGATVNTWVGMSQLQTGLFPTSYVAQPAAAGAIRAADNMTFIPWRISDDLASKVNATPRLLFTGGESLNGTTVAPTVGGYSFTKNGRPQNLDTYSTGTSFSLGGTPDYLTRADTGPGDPFRPTGDFSVMVAFTPKILTGTQVIIGKWTTTDDQRSWYLGQSTAGITLIRTNLGTAVDALSIVKPNCLEVGKPTLITATYSTTAGMSIYVDAMPVTASALPTGVIFSGTGAVQIGHSAGAFLTGDIHYLAYYDNYVVGQTEHDNAYAAFKMDGVLPLNISSTAAKKKLVVECEVKGQYASAADNGGQYRTFLSIGGAYGTSSATRNNLYLQSAADGSSYSVLHTDGSATDRYIYSAVRTDHDKWTRHKWVVDTADLSLSTYSINGVLQTGFTQMTGTAEFGLRDTLIRIGQGGTGTILGNMEIRNVKLGAE
jgi:hypothetical protein